MRVAVPLFGSRVSPRFDCAQVFLIATPDEGGTWQRQELSAADWAPHERINRLVALGIDNLICGGIDWWSSESLLSAGILVFDSITGEADEALAAWRRGPGRGQTQGDRRTGRNAAFRSSGGSSRPGEGGGGGEAVGCRIEEASPEARNASSVARRTVLRT